MRRILEEFSTKSSDWYVKTIIQLAADNGFANQKSIFWRDAAKQGQVYLDEIQKLILVRNEMLHGKVGSTQRSNALFRYARRFIPITRHFSLYDPAVAEFLNCLAVQVSAHETSENERSAAIGLLKYILSRLIIPSRQGKKGGETEELLICDDYEKEHERIAKEFKKFHRSSAARRVDLRTLCPTLAEKMIDQLAQGCTPMSIAHAVIGKKYCKSPSRIRDIITKARRSKTLEDAFFPILRPKKGKFQPLRFL